MPKNGIDLSTWNDVYDYTKLLKDQDFVMIRAGFGFNTVDNRMNKHIAGCKNNKKPYGFYWFSYAMDVESAKKEAKFFVDLIKDISNPVLPLYFDWEYASDDYARKHGVTVTSAMLKNMAVAFCNEVKNAGYKAGVYCNPDYVVRYYGSPDWFTENGLSLWLAQWGAVSSYTCDIWQYSERGSLSGVSGNVDLDLCYLDIEGTKSDKTIEECLEEVLDEYDDICFGILQGEYGSGAERKEQLGKYYDIAQDLINQAYKRKEGLF